MEKVDIKKLKKDKIEILEGLRFWLAVLRKTDGFTDVEREKLNIAYHEVNKVYENFEQDRILDKLLSED